MSIVARSNNVAKPSAFSEAERSAANRVCWVDPAHFRVTVMLAVPPKARKAYAFIKPCLSRDWGRCEVPIIRLDRLFETATFRENVTSVIRASAF